MAMTVLAKEAAGVLLLQLVLVIIFAVCTVYDAEADAKKPSATAASSMQQYYPMFQDVHVMVFVGFGFLMTFLKKYGYSSVGFTLLLGALMIQWALLCKGFYHMDTTNGKIRIGITSILSADLATAAVLISMGAVLGKTTAFQLLLMGIIEMVICVSNEHLGITVLKAVDAGGSIYVHIFGAYFGLAVSLMLKNGAHVSDSNDKDNKFPNNEEATYTSDLFAMIGTVFLWLFWPSFNGVFSVGDDQHRAVINTYLSLASCCVTAFAISSLVGKDNKLNMVHIQNATLAGGVAIGTAADMMIQPYGAILVGMFAGAISVLGYHYLQPYLLERLHLHDTCGVHNLHGIPGVIAGIVGAILAALASEADYNYSLYQHFPARAPRVNESDFWEYKTHLDGTLEPGDGRSAGEQAGYQLLAVVVTLAIAITSGAITGYILRLPFIGKVPKKYLFDDHHQWEVPESDSPKENNEGSNIIETMCYDPRLQV